MGGESVKDVAGLLKKLRAKYPETGAACADGVCELDSAEPMLGLWLRSFLMWDAPSALAHTAAKAIERGLVDFNELRVCLPDELVALMGEKYPKAGERALRMRSALSALYTREHCVSLEHLMNMNKRQAQEYLVGLEGTPGYVASRVVLLALGAHAAPVDHRIAARLTESGLIEANISPDTAAGVLERQIHAGEMPEAYALLQAHADSGVFPLIDADAAPRLSLKAVPKAARNGTASTAMTTDHARKPATRPVRKGSGRKPTRPER